MADHFLLFIGAFEGSTPLSVLPETLRKELPRLDLYFSRTWAEALSLLNENPTMYEVVVIDQESSGLPDLAAIAGVKDVTPDVEVILVGPPSLKWSASDLTVDLRPVIFHHPVSPELFSSCLGKHLEVVQLKKHLAGLDFSYNQRTILARKNVEAVLALLNRPVGVGMISMRRDGFFTFYNPEARHLTGYSQDDVPHIRIWAETLLRTPTKIQSTLTQLSNFWVKGPSRDEILLKIRHRNGNIVNLSISVLIVQNDKGEPRQMVMLLFDPNYKSEIMAYRTLLEQGPIGFYTYGLREGFERISVSAVELINRAFSLSLQIGDFLGRQIQDLPLPNSAAEEWQRSLEKAMNRNGDLPPQPPQPLGLPGQRILEHSFLAPFGAPLQDPSGVVTVVNARDDLRAESYQDLDNADLSQLTLRRHPHPFLLLKAVRDDDGTIQDFICLDSNQAAGVYLKIGENGGVYKGLGELIPDPELADTLFQNLRGITELGGQDRFETKYRNWEDGGAEKIVHFWAGKVGDGVGVFFRDVTAERIEERILKQYRHIFAHMEESIIVTDLEGRIIDWNPASQRMFGYNRIEMLGKPVFILTHTNNGEPLPQEAREILRQGDVWTGEYHYTHKDGRSGIASTVFALLKDDQGKPYGTVGLSIDVTESKRLEERLTIRTRELQEKNLALNTLLRHAEEERVRACQQVASDVTGKITEGINKIMESRQNPELVENLGRLLLQDLGRPSDPFNNRDAEDPIMKLTEKELEVARLIRLGKTTEDIAFILNKSPDTVRLQRISIRKKLGLSSRDRNLYKFLNNIDMF